MTEYSVEVCKALERKFRDVRLHRPMRIRRYDAGTELVYEVSAVSGADTGRPGRVHLVVEKFVGGGFAGQVYRVKVVEIENGPIEGLKKEGVYAMKILVPPSGASLLFRNLMYAVGFQGPFQLQANPAAVRAGAIWQKFFKRGAKIRFGGDKAVSDIHVIFVDSKLGSCGELTDWVEGRTWRLEVDERMDLLSCWRKGKEVNADQLGSPEYRAKKQFMDEFVKLLHDMGGHEFARQYEWSTCKSQPNCLKCKDSEDNPSAGLTAVDFRAGLALLPFLPMSPGDFKLIAQGIGHGSLVQFDRGDVEKLEAFVDSHSKEFADIREMLGELKSAEQVYRDSIPDITHNHVRLLYSRSLWSTILDSAVTGWKVRNIIDQQCEEKLRCSKFSTLIFLMIGLIPFLGWFVRRIWGRSDWRKHYREMLTSQKYLKQAIQGKVTEKVIIWHRAGRVDNVDAMKVAGSVWLFLCHLPLSILPAGMHRFLTDWEYFKQRLSYIIVRPVRLYFNSELREQWLRDMVTEGLKKQIISEEDAGVILSQIKEPFIQKYLKSLAVHVCTLPVTQVVSVIVAITYVMMHPELPQAQAWAIGLGIIALFQVVPVSPGSLTRGLYVVYLVISERNFKDYNIAVFLGFFKYIGYLAFPIQMTYRYPTLAKFMAAHWATDVVHVVPVFGEGGALLEHGVFCLFYNWPLTIRRGMRKRAEMRAEIKPRYWHVGLCAIVAAAIFGIADFIYYSSVGALPGLKDIAWFAAIVPLMCGAGVTLGCGGALLSKRLITAALCAVMVGVLYTVVSAIIGNGGQIEVVEIAVGFFWRVFVFTVLSTIGAVLMELKLPEVDLG